MLLGWGTGPPQWRLKGWSGQQSFNRSSVAGCDLDHQGASLSLLKAALTVGGPEALESDSLGGQFQFHRSVTVFPAQMAEPL